MQSSLVIAQILGPMYVIVAVGLLLNNPACEAINRYIETHNESPKPFVWTADPNRIIEKVIRGKQALESNH